MVNYKRPEGLMTIKKKGAGSTTSDEKELCRLSKDFMVIDAVLNDS